MNRNIDLKLTVESIPQKINIPVIADLHIYVTYNHNKLSASPEHIKYKEVTTWWGTQILSNKEMKDERSTSTSRGWDYLASNNYTLVRGADISNIESINGDVTLRDSISDCERWK